MLLDMGLHTALARRIVRKGPISRIDLDLFAHLPLFIGTLLEKPEHAASDGG